MKVNNYELKVNNVGSGELYAFRNGDKILIDVLDIKDKNSVQVEQLIKETLEKHQIEVVDVEETILEKFDLVDRKSDLSLVRHSMRKILKNFGSTKVSLDEKKELLEVYETMCKASSVITKACTVELAYDRFEKEIDD